MAFTAYKTPPAAPSDADLIMANGMILNKVMAVIHRRAEVIVMEMVNGALDMDNDPISTVRQLNDRIILDIEGKDSDFAAPCSAEEILYVLGDELPDNDYDYPRNGNAAIEVVQSLALHAYYVGMHNVLTERFGMASVDGPVFGKESPAGIYDDDSVSSILRHEIKRIRELALQIEGRRSDG
jgi:hypothetical protein